MLAGVLAAWERAASRREGLALAALLMGALALRLWGLDAVPPGLSHDEAYDALNAVEILGGARPAFFESNNGREPLFMYLVAVSFGAFGVGAAPLRAVSALAGTIAVGLAWAAARRAFAPPVAW